LIGVSTASEKAALQQLDKLSPREKDIFFLIAQSLSNKKIARDLDIAETTVKIHIQHIFKKLSLTSRVQIAVFAASHGLS
jgi:two-component system nitrate/nitrite response regulator NarL